MLYHCRWRCSVDLLCQGRQEHQQVPAEAPAVVLVQAVEAVVEEGALEHGVGEGEEGGEDEHVEAARQPRVRAETLEERESAAKVTPGKLDEQLVPGIKHQGECEK